MSHATKLDSFLMSYNNSVAWGKMDRNEAVHRAIDQAFPELKMVEKADLFAKIIEGFEEYDRKRMVSRRMWLGQLIKKWQMERGVVGFRVARGSGPTAQEQQQATASGGTVPDSSVAAFAAKLASERALLTNPEIASSKEEDNG